MSAASLDTAAAAAAADADEPPKKKHRANARPRAPARPYKRLEAAVLTSRIAELNKKVSVLRSKLVLLEDRLDGHQHEARLREDLAAMP